LFAAIRRNGLAPQRRAADHPAIDSLAAALRTTMNHTLIQRACSLGLAFAVTLMVLGGIDLIAQPDAGAALWALLDTVSGAIG
jgi:hypothetical protein